VTAGMSLTEDDVAAVTAAVAAALTPNMGPVVVPDHVAEIFAECSRLGARTYLQLYGTGAHHVAVTAQFTARGTLLLDLEVDAWSKVWSGELRAAAGGS
jgi:hypothetical protein